MTNEPRPPDGSAESSQVELQPPAPPPARSGPYPETHAPKSCPACAQWMPNEAFVCRVCRYDLRTGTYADVRPRTNGLATASLIMGLVALMIFPLIPLSALGGLLAVVMGGTAKRQIKRSGSTMSGAEMARFGMVLGLVALLVALGLTVAAYALDIELIDVDLS